MSRHRNVRNLDVNAVLEEDDYDSYDDYEEYDNEVDQEELDNAVDQVREILGDDSIARKDIEESLWHYYLDVDKTVAWFLDSAEKEKKKKQEELEKAKAQQAKLQERESKKTSKPQDFEEIVEVEDDINEHLRFDLDALNFKGSVPDAPAPVIKQRVRVESSEAKAPVKPVKLANRINVEEEFRKREADKVGLNLVVIGHVDAGKSTLMGHLLYLLGEVNDRTMKKFERESQKIGKSSFAYAWVLDATDEERSRGVTMDVAITKFESANRKFTLLDAPGHRDFVPNMISGAAQADVAILVVDASPGEFESGFIADGQTKEHALLVRSLGVQQLAIAVNKLDNVDWSQARFEEIKEQLLVFLTQAGFRKQNISFIPVSGLTGENMIKVSEDNSKLRSWYSGPTLLEKIDSFEPPARPLDKPFRLPVADFFKGGVGSTSGVTVSGRIEGGTIQIGEQVGIAPIGEYAIVKAIESNEESVKWAAAGDTAMLTLTNIDILQLSIGSVLCSPTNMISVASKFKAQIVVFDIAIPITIGYPIILHHQSLNEPAVITNLLEVLDKSTGEVVKKKPRCLTKATTATIEIKTQRPLCLETYKEFKDLGRVMLRKGGDTIAAGIITEIYPESQA
ncbi:hypothetical protein K493DRAFT_285504 [Basidiobolus meristosporus CBS 931.73]|uniref:Elongation factor 1 alpha-like protein n=1 Tax=Basidiobolus meristosporus CBS 931.73 TaxID=1314790 RepID=A0A1Y1Y3X1_9FUNG|nr:hypothetical protein K493DRAFT_285504 [Basidiobolus meristosporus CBS 931.73]|eukprot:ORX92697.1 hypothetical protein K493DRAFT_285504 [Basidiobolus meristosporus CBS 931.73]